MNDFSLRTCKYDFASDAIDIIVLLYDYSGSMQHYKGDMLKANEAFYQDFSRFEEKGSIAIAKGMFDSSFSMTSFDSIEKFNRSYSAYGGTKLYYAIVEATKKTIAYYDEIVKRLNIRPKITFLVFSDGGDNESPNYYDEAKRSITLLNSLDATTVFVAFGAAIKNEAGNDLKFSCTKDINSVEELVRCMGTELSKSCKEQSKSAYSLKSEFFSKADKNSEEDDTEKQTIIDDNFFDI